MKPTVPSAAALRAAAPKLVHSFFTRNLPYKAVALFLSFVLWIVVERQSPRAQEERIDVQLVFRMDSSLVRVSPLPEVRARIMVSAGDLLRLETERPQIRRSFENDAPDSVLVTLRRSDVVLPEGMRARVLDIQPTSFVIRFDSLMQKTVPVRSALRVAPGEGVAIAGAPRFEPDSVSIVGRRQTVVDVLSVSTESSDVIVSDTTPVAVRLLPPAPGVEVIPADVKVRVPIVITVVQ